jgi:hypothetical protein
MQALARVDVHLENLEWDGKPVRGDKERLGLDCSPDD